MKLFPSVLLLSPLFVAQAVCAQVQHLPSEAATAEQRLAEDIGIDRLTSSANLPLPGNGQSITALQQIGRRNEANVSQQGTSATANQAYMLQVGAANTLNLTQNGGGNTVLTLQNGNNNDTRFTQNGQGNSSAITQKGSNNKLDGLVDGNRNKVDVLQDGYNNSVKGELHQDAQTYSIRQYGSGNTLTQLETITQGRRGYSVEMRGNGINLTIEQGKVLP